jgi:hypothetical protein
MYIKMCCKSNFFFVGLEKIDYSKSCKFEGLDLEEVLMTKKLTSSIIFLNKYTVRIILELGFLEIPVI